MALNTEERKVAHLLRRAGFGYSQAELEQYSSLGLEATLDALLNYEQVDEGFDLDPWALRPERKKDGQKQPNLPPQLVASWWSARILLTRRPLQEKMTLFWHDHFGCSAEKVKGGALNLQHNELLRSMAVGGFEDLLQAVAKDPTMLRFLDTGDNVKGQPNENFARELMELYTLGIGHYSEQDIQEAARAFTGWSVQRPDPEDYLFSDKSLPGFRLRQRLHDEGVKTILGHSGKFGGEDVIHLLCQQEQCHRYISAKLWNWFGYSDPEPELIERLAGGFRTSGLSIRGLLRDIFSAPEFYSERAEYALYKSPADFVAGTLRAANIHALLARAAAGRQNLEGIELPAAPAASDAEGYLIGRGVPRQVLGLMRVVMQAMKNQGMALLFPPSVAGWDGGSAWVNSASMVERIKLADIFSEKGLETRNRNAAGKGKAGKADGAANDADDDKAVGGRRALAGQAQRVRRIPAEAVLGSRAFASTQEAATQVLSAFDSRLPAEKRALIIDSVVQSVGSRAATPEARQQVVYQTARLLFASPEYQLM